MNIVTARCPHCKNQLRIPADWLERPMRCKHCKNTFQAKAKSEPAVPQAAAPQPAAAAPPPPVPVPPVPVPEVPQPPVPTPQYQYPQPPVGSPPGYPAMPGWPAGVPMPPQYYQPAPGMPPMMMPPGYMPPGYAPPGYGMPPGYGPPGMYPAPAPVPQPAAAAPFGFDESQHDVDEAPSYDPRAYSAPAAPPPAYGQPSASAFATSSASDIGGTATETVSTPRRRPVAKKSNTVALVVVGVLFVATAAVLAVVVPQLQTPTVPHDSDPVAKTKKKLTPAEQLAAANKKALEMSIAENKAKKTPGTNPGTNPPIRPVFSGALPRRALFIAPENYLNLNSTLWYQDREGEGANIQNALLYRFTQGAPLNIERNQIFVLTDADENKSPGSAPLKETIEAAVKDFCETSRAQDRIILFFSGHACEIDGKGYLIPLEADKDDKAHCIAIDWVYEQLAKCKARQKIFIVDAFRFPPARGLELPDTGPMTEAVDKQLDSPPPGVQVVTACLKDQQALEFEAGSLFQSALRDALSQMKLGAIAQGKDPIPIADLVAKANDFMKKELSSSSMAMEKKDEKDAPLMQTCRLSGKEPETGADPNPTEPAPKAVAFLQTDRDGKGSETIKGILDEIKRFPPMKKSQVSQLANLSISALPNAKELDAYKDEGFNPFEAKDEAAVVAMRDKYPHRVICYEIAAKLNEFIDMPMKEYFANPGGPLDAKAKGRFLQEQKDPALATLAMEELLQDARKLADDIDNEKSKRWRAHFDLSLARLQARLVYVYEYNNLIALIRGDALPELQPIHSGWRVNTSAKIQIKEATVKDMAKQATKIWDRMGKDYANTPWAIIAKRERNVSMGLSWVPTKN